MKCLVCSKEIEGMICENCLTNMKGKFVLKCLNCGSFGFIPQTEANIQRIRFFMEKDDDFLLNIQQHPEGIIIPTQRCPECLEYFGLENIM